MGIWNGLLSANYDIIPLVERLKLDYNLILASNTNPIHFAHTIQNCGVLENFERFFLSYAMRLLKLDPEFYGHVLKTLAVPAGECVFIDNLVENVESARSVGITSFRFVSVDRLERALVTILCNSAGISAEGFQLCGISSDIFPINSNLNTLPPRKNDYVSSCGADRPHNPFLQPW